MELISSNHIAIARRIRKKAQVAVGISNILVAAYAPPALAYSKGTPVAVGYSQIGIASRYNAAKKLTTAHKTFPIGTKVLVTNHKNQKTVCVSVEDRGPYVDGRIVDLSYDAADQIDLTHKQGVTPVTIRVVDACP